MEKIPFNLLVQIDMEERELTEEYVGKVAALVDEPTLIKEFQFYTAEQVNELIQGESERVRGRIEGVTQLLDRMRQLQQRHRAALLQETIDEDATINGPIGSSMSL